MHVDMHDEILQCLRDLWKHCKWISRDYKLNDKSTETDQFVARIHRWRILNQSLVLGDINTPRRYCLAKLYELCIVSAWTVMSAAALHARRTRRWYLTWRTDISSWRGYECFLLNYLFYLEFADEIIFSRRRIILGTIVECKCKNAYENVFQQVFHFRGQTYYKKSKWQLLGVYSYNFCAVFNFGLNFQGSYCVTAHPRRKIGQFFGDDCRFPGFSPFFVVLDNPCKKYPGFFCKD